MDDETDYMSDSFLEQLQDIRPGLVSKTVKRKNKISDISKKKETLPKSKKIKLAESEARQHGLSVPIPPDNRGFAMLQKMGYKEGMGLGKSGEGSTSLISLVVKDGKYGLGRSKFVEEKKVQKEVQLQEKKTKDLAEFLKRKQMSSSQRKTELDMRKSQLACEQLDVKISITTPVERWFWPKEVFPEEEDTQEDSSDSDYDEESDSLDKLPFKLASLTNYLRSIHFYCIWCGTAFEDEKDMQQNCPGDNAEVHDD